MTIRFLAPRRTFILLASTAFACVAAACAHAPVDSEGVAQSALGTAPSLGVAGSFTVLAGTTVTNTGPTMVTGDLGVDPGLAITGFPPGLVVGGATHAGDAVALQAQSDATAAYGVLASEPCGTDLTGKDLGGLTLVPGVYCFSSSAQLTGALVLDAQGKNDSVFVFKMASTLTTASNASVSVINGGTDCGVFWQVGSSAVIGTGTALSGTVIALTSISLATGAKVSGRVLARNGAVTMDDNVIGVGSCAGAVVADAGSADASRPDAGSPGVDAGQDAAVAIIDAAVVDAAPAATDAATSDASTTDTDASTTPFDGGTGTN